MSEKKPQPLNSRKGNKRCPVCGEISYSRAGVHPQCSVRQADEKRKSRIKLEKLAAEAEKTSTAASRTAAWQKNCPKCHALQHVRKLICRCGHRFAAKARPPNDEAEAT